MHFNITGKPFSTSNSCLLDGICRSRRYRSHKWISISTASLINLSVRTPSSDLSSHVPVCLHAMNKKCLFHNIDVFVECEEEIKRRYNSVCNAGCADGKSENNKLEHHNSISRSNRPRPLNTNGEFFDSACENIIMNSYPELLMISPYWVTADEASFVYQAPFIKCGFENTYATQNINGACIRYYHVSCTSNPKIFNPLTCCRYDPYNFFGVHYRPTTALVMKRYAIQNHCCSFQRWITVQRSQQLGVEILSHIAPLSLILSNEVVQLVNTGLTTKPEVIENLAVKPVNVHSIREQFIQNLSFRGCHF